VLWYQALILGAVQGLTEFWPVSSTAHVALLIWLTGWGDPSLSFTVALHGGTLLAVVVFFRATIVRLLKAAWDIVREREVGQDRDRRLAAFLAVAFIPAALIGVVASDSADMMESMPLLMIMVLLLFSFFLAWVDTSRSHLRDMDSLGYRGSLVTGIFQVFAMVPGVSRSGATISAGLLQGLKREDAVEFSFLLSIPTIGAAFVFSLFKMVKDGAGGQSASAMLLGAAAAAITGLFAIAFLLKWVRDRDFKPFIIYRIVLALVLLAVYILK
jgi:undecaprenyl-diphosphatase